MFTKRKLSLLLVLVFLLVAVATAACGGVKQQVETKPTEETKPKVAGLPDMMTWTAYDVGSGGYIQVAAVANSITKKTGTKIRILPSGTSVGRLMPINSGVASYSFAADETAFSFEGQYEFADIAWGPQDYRVALVVPAATAVAVAKDSGITKPAEFKGKRVAWVVAAPSLYVKMGAALAFGGLTWNDVVKVEFPSYAASLKGLVEGTVDVAWSNLTSPVMAELQSSKRGLLWPEFPASDTEGWARMNKIAPWIGPYKWDDGIGLTKGQPLELLKMGYPQIVTRASQSDEEVYQLVKVINETFDDYKGANPILPEWILKKSGHTPAGAPFHPGAVKYLKEKGVWTADDEKWNNAKLEQAKKLKEAWNTVISESTAKQVPQKEFVAFWEKRKAELVGK